MTQDSVPAAVGTWRLRFETKRGEEQPVVAFAADGSGVFQSPEGPLPVAATFDGDDVHFSANHKTVMRDFPIRFRATVDGDTMDGAMLTVSGPHPMTGERIA